MARQDAYAADETTTASAETDSLVQQDPSPPQYTYRHGDGRAEILKVEVLDGLRRPVEIVESGEPLVVSMRLLFHTDVEHAVCGFMIRNRHGIHLYGTNTELQHLDLGPVKRGALIEVDFAFNCWLAPDAYSIAVASHSPDAVSFDWLDGAYFFRVVSGMQMEGVANLNATVSMRRLGFRPTQPEAESKTEPLRA